MNNIELINLTILWQFYKKYSIWEIKNRKKYKIWKFADVSIFGKLESKFQKNKLHRFLHLLHPSTTPHFN